MKKKKIYDGFDNLIITGVEWSCEMARNAALTKDKKIVHIDHPVNLSDIFYPREAKVLRSELGIPETNKVVLTATSATAPRKGGVYFLQLAERLKHRKDITFVFIGYNRNDWDIPDNMKTIGYISSQDKLAQYYSIADLYVCTSLADTFPTTCINSLGCGVPLLGFSTGGVPYLAPKEYGTYVPAGDIDKLVMECEKVIIKTPETIKAIRDYALGRYSESVINSKFYNLYKSNWDNHE
jgi:glycosyltransferase involved in cell wall biosynthesis